jgi:hypothetical protein
MAIQLNDRDHLIFKLIDEHQVLLEKHIAWFISSDNKPVLIRDRLRKLFYLDYLLCHRHGTKLPWWTTPTKPLVYLLSPMARTLSDATATETDLFDSDVQRHFLEIANLRMLGLMGQQEGQLSEFRWTTCKDKKHLDAKVSFINGGKMQKLGIVNHPPIDNAVVENVAAAMKTDDLEKVLVVCRDDLHQQKLQKLIAASSINASCFFATHQEIYGAGIVKTAWRNVEGTQAALFTASLADTANHWGPGFNPSTSSAIA